MPELDTELPRDIFYASFDDLRLHVRHYPAPDAKLRSVICLAGLTRNGRDFNHLATYLSRHPGRPRNVYCLDYRGRGASQYDRNWRNYVPYIELLDTLDFLTVQGLHRAGIVGTSRGGIIAMMMAAFRPTAMGPVVLNDIGPVIETRGLARIVGYVGRMPVPRTWPDAVWLMREMNEWAFPTFDDADWEDMARGIFDERKGRLALAYDRRLARAFGRIDLSRPVPDLWPQFIALGQVPAFVLRGANSDVLSAETLEAIGAFFGAND
jgi:pimeloyl-ACP methyl ester carboxylesterase